MRYSFHCLRIFSGKLKTILRRQSTTPLLLSAVLISLMVGCDGCDPGNPLLAAFRDSDGDGWYDENRNQRIEVFIDSVETIGTTFGGNPTIAIDDRIVSTNSEPFQTNVPVALRTIGNWGAPEKVEAFGADLRIRNIGDISSSERERFVFQNVNATFEVRFAGFVVHFRTVRTLFPDPLPNDPNGDSDQDGLTDTEEAKLQTLHSRSAGNPFEKDILLVVGFTHPDWKLTQHSQDLLTTAFFNKARINLTIFTENDPILGVTPGRIRINGEFPARNHTLSLNEARVVRTQLLANDVALLFHVVVLAEQLDTGGWGQAEVARPANDLICRSHLPILGPDIHDYQAKDVMHELGHNLGLCHPTESTADCPTGSIPTSERSGGLSAMGTPAESAGPVEVMIEAMSRPLNYTPGQWTNMDLRRIKP